ncbi:hypothetical protein BM477_00745 [Boudabousia marimammalium]|uniref:Band 7 domain-containing protein n=1 Tax=Boudabousia marimammalium TaxID=156892 RepID=A0A1Q5PSZ7_9ACTO|nr:hypothetical protein BM477_00745 [Boudabousia marimammalium]
MGGFLVALIIFLIIAAVVTAIFVLASRAWIKVARADEALVISGKRQVLEDGTESPVTVIVNGKSLVNPITQRHEIISLRSRQVIVNAQAQSLDKIEVDVEAVALVKIGNTPDLVRLAAERFASQDEVIEVFIREQLEGALRGVIAKQKVTELMESRQIFSDHIFTEIRPDLEKQGLVLDSFSIKEIRDSIGYIESLGTPEAEAKRQAAEIAKTDAERAITKQRIANEEQNLIENTEFKRNQAEANATTGKANAEAEQAERLAREAATERVLKQQALNKRSSLDAEVRQVADAELYRRQREAEARKIEAEADAEVVKLAGQAKAEAILAEAQALRENQDAILAQRALEILPELMMAFADGYAKIGKITIVGGSGQASAGENLSQEMPVAMSGVFESMKAATGLDLAAMLQGRMVGQGIAQGLTESNDADGGVDADN